MSKHLTVILTIALLAGSSCASGPPVTADDLKLKRVVIYRNGVAYFEREGRVQGERVRFQVRGDEVGDFLASFAVIEKGGSSRGLLPAQARRASHATRCGREQAG